MLVPVHDFYPIIRDATHASKVGPPRRNAALLITKTIN